MTDELDFTAERGDMYLKLEDGISYYLTFAEKLPDHEDFMLGKGKKAVPAPVFRVVDRAGKGWRLSITSTQLWASLEKAAAHYGGSFMNRRLKITPEGDGKDRAYIVRGVTEPTGTQAALQTEA